MRAPAVFRLVLILAIAGAVSSAMPRAYAIDLTGAWRIEHDANRRQYVELIDVDGAVSGVLPGLDDWLGDEWTLEASFDELDRTLDGDLFYPPLGSAPSGSLTATLFPDGNHFDGTLSAQSESGPETLRTVANRCECDDENTVDGDGCDAGCRVEPCWTCAGAPSVCSPAAEAAPCDDRSVCTSGETCTAGVCGGGTPSTPCVDFTGLWFTTQDLTGATIQPPAVAGSPYRVRRAEQHGETVLFHDVQSGDPDYFGTIDSETGAFTVAGGRLYASTCNATPTLTGTLAEGGNDFEASGTSSGLCIVGPVSLSGTRLPDGCGDGTPGPGEECDDGDQEAGDGCDPNCTVTACGNDVLTSGEACDDGNLTSGDGCDQDCTVTACGNGIVTAGEACDDGNLDSGDGCDANCTVTACGNGILTSGETCDDGNLVSGDGCDANCKPTGCRNGIVTGLEVCDDGNTISGDGCDNNCRPTGCGNGEQTAGEFCDDANLINGDNCDANCTITACGNGIVTSGEACDDHNLVSGDGCDENCTTTACGNGVVTSGEACDDGDLESGDGCDQNCTATACGNGITTAPEVCDDGNLESGDGCDANCTATACGNGITTAPEVCDDGDLESGDGCDANCTATACGNGIAAGAEECDDHNLISDDGCDANCTVTACGNGIVTSAEACDDDNLVSGDGCDEDCTVTACGNGITTAPETCDDGNLESGDGCDANCQPTACGNGAVTDGEACDDGNLVSGDGCDANCTVTGCGNGVVTSGEACDDGNLEARDGCSASCTVEPCFECSGSAPSTCGVRIVTTCTSPLRPERANLKIQNKIGTAKDTIQLRLSKNMGMPFDDLGRPLLTTPWELCLVDQSGPTPRLVFASHLSAAGTCGGSLCWRPKGLGYLYSDKPLTHTGINKLQLVGGTSPNAGVVMKGKGATVSATTGGLPTLPLTPPLLFQIRRADGGPACYQVKFAPTTVIQNDPVVGKFLAVGSP
jgi:cysteine-rich repeat protein